MQDELTTEMHAEFLGKDFTPDQIKMMGVIGAMRSGLSMEEALNKYDAKEEDLMAYIKEKNITI